MTTYEDPAEILAAHGEWLEEAGDRTFTPAEMRLHNAIAKRRTASPDLTALSVERVARALPYWRDGSHETCVNDARTILANLGATAICGVIWPGGPNGEPLGCAYPPNPPGERMHEHSWAWVSTPAATPDCGHAEEIERLRAVAEIVRRHTHQGLLAMTYHAGPDPENDCLLCRALVDAGVLTLDGIGAGTRAAILAERAALDAVLAARP